MPTWTAGSSGGSSPSPRDLCSGEPRVAVARRPPPTPGRPLAARHAHARHGRRGVARARLAARRLHHLPHGDSGLLQHRAHHRLHLAGGGRRLDHAARAHGRRRGGAGLRALPALLRHGGDPAPGPRAGCHRGGRRGSGSARSIAPPARPAARGPAGDQRGHRCRGGGSVGSRRRRPARPGRRRAGGRRRGLHPLAVAVAGPRPLGRGTPSASCAARPSAWLRAI